MISDDSIAALPKAELHCHLGGVLDPAMVRDLARDGHDFGIDATELAACYPITSATGFTDVYLAFVDRFLKPRDARLLPLLIRQVRRWNRQNVTYAELFVSDILLARADLGELIALYQLYRDAARAEAAPGLHVALVACIGRGPLERMTRQIERVIALFNAGAICGLSIAGLAETPLAGATHLFEQLRDTGMGISIHAGETGGPDSVWDALACKPHRLGHALAAFHDERLIERLHTDNIHLEFCPTSNLRLGCISSIDAHPLLLAKRHGLRFSVNTDDPGAFQCSLTSELELVQHHFGLSRADLLAIHADTVAAGFSSITA